MLVLENSWLVMLEYNDIVLGVLKTSMICPSRIKKSQIIPSDLSQTVVIEVLFVVLNFFEFYVIMAPSGTTRPSLPTVMPLPQDYNGLINPYSAQFCTILYVLLWNWWYLKCFSDRPLFCCDGTSLQVELFFDKFTSWVKME